MKKIISLLIFCSVSLFSHSTLQSQNETTTTSQTDNTPSVLPFFSLSGGWTFPFGEMGERYSSFLNLNGSFGIKTQQNWMIDAQFIFQFGSNNVKHLENYLQTLYTDNTNNFIIGADGLDGGVVAYNRNLGFDIGISKICNFAFLGQNNYIGLRLGGGMLQHQIIYQASQSRVFALEGDYALGYDRQMRGLLLSSNVFFMHLSTKSYANFIFSVEYDVIFSKMTRSYQFDLRSGDDKRYKDYMLTLKVGWIIPFFTRDTNKIYYF